MSFDILSFRDRLEVVKEDRSQIVCKCPVCGGTNLKIDQKSGKWQCWDYPNDEQHKRAIRDAINPPTKPGDRTEKPPRIEARTEWVYKCADGKHRIKVTRIDIAGGKKNFYQSYKVKNRWTKSKDVDPATKDHIRSQVLPLYHQEIVDKMPNHRHLFICEGEKSADAFRSLGLLATTVLSAKWTGVRDYSEVFRGLEDRLVIVPDRDKSGAAFAMGIYRNFPQSRWLHPYPDSPLWSAKLPPDKGVDIADWIADGATAEDIEGAIIDLPKVAIANYDQEVPAPAPAIPPGTEKFHTEGLTQQIHRIIDRELDEGDACAALIELSDRTGKPLSVLKQLHKSCLAQRRRDEALQEGASGLKTLVRYAKNDIPLHSILPAPLANALLTKADSDRVDPVRLISNLLPAISTLLGGRTSIIAKRGGKPQDNWVEYPIFWTCDCSPPSSGKSASQRAIFAPLQERQKAADAKHQAQLDALEQAVEEWMRMSAEDKDQYRGTNRDPSMLEHDLQEKVLLIEVGQIEAVLKLMGKLTPKAGLVWLRDELVGLFKSMDQYKSGGKGEGLQILLTAWNGPLFTRIRRAAQGESFNLGGQTLNICGGIQPDVARKLFALQDDPDGLLSRILPCVPKIPDDFAQWSDVGVDLYRYLDQVFEALEGIAKEEFHFSAAAETMWRRRWELLKQGYVKNLENNPSFAYFLGKQCSYVPR
ncbi:MAG: DUF3987 domain-containing protein, partial [Cyanobacteria bacterium P01_D01_bin.73]